MSKDESTLTDPTESGARGPTVPWVGGRRALCPSVYFFLLPDQMVFASSVLSQLCLGKYLRILLLASSFCILW